MRPLRILLLSTQRAWYGGEEQLRQLAHGLRSRGHSPLVMLPARSDARVRLASEDVPLLPFPRRGHTPRGLWRINRAARNVDLVHCNDPHSLSAAGLALRASRRPAVVVSRRVAFEPQSPWAYMRWSDLVVCVSRAIEERCLQSGIPSDRLRVVLDGVDPQRMAGGNRERGRAALRVSDDIEVVLCVASLREAKGHRDLVEAARRLLPRRPRARFFLAGDGPERARLEEQAAQLGDRLVFLGYREDIPDLMAACDLFVLPSRDEGLGSSVIDAMLAARRVVGTRAGGMPEILQSDDSAETLPGSVLADPANPGGLAEAIDRLLSHTGDTVGLRQRALDRFTADTMVESTLAVYRELVR